MKKIFSQRFKINSSGDDVIIASTLPPDCRLPTDDVMTSSRSLSDWKKRFSVFRIFSKMRKQRNKKTKIDDDVTSCVSDDVICEPSISETSNRPHSFVFTSSDMMTSHTCNSNQSTMMTSLPGNSELNSQKFLSKCSIDSTSSKQDHNHMTSSVKDQSHVASSENIKSHVTSSEHIKIHVTSSDDGKNRVTSPEHNQNLLTSIQDQNHMTSSVDDQRQVTSSEDKSHVTSPEEDKDHVTSPEEDKDHVTSLKQNQNHMASLEKDQNHMTSLEQDQNHMTSLEQDQNHMTSPEQDKKQIRSLEEDEKQTMSSEKLHVTSSTESVTSSSRCKQLDTPTKRAIAFPGVVFRRKRKGDVTAFQESSKNNRSHLAMSLNMDELPTYNIGCHDDHQSAARREIIWRRSVLADSQLAKMYFSTFEDTSFALSRLAELVRHPRDATGKLQVVSRYQIEKLLRMDDDDFLNYCISQNQVELGHF